MRHHISYKPLISKWEDFLNSGGKYSLENFANYILGGNKKDNLQEGGSWMNQEMEDYFEKNTQAFQFQQNSPEAATLIWRLYKFIRIYTKPVIQEVGLASNDEFAILATVDARKECSKKAAINENLIELTTGVDMIKRLVKQGLLLEKTNKDDKREKLISLSEKGRELLYLIFQKFAGIQDVLGDLGEQERNVLIKYLKTLDVYHTNIVMPTIK